MEQRFYNLYRELEALSNLSPAIDDCSEKENALYSAIEKLRICLEDLGYDVDPEKKIN